MRVELTIGLIERAYTMSKDRKLVRTRQRQPDFVRKAGPMDTSRRIRERQEDRELRDELEEFMADYDGDYSVFGD